MGIKSKKDQETIDKILKEYRASITAQIKKGATSGFIPGYFKWSKTEAGIKIELLEGK